MLSGLSPVTGEVFTLESSAVNLAFVIPWLSKILLMAAVGEAKIPIIRCSTEVYSSPMDFAAFSAAVMILLVSGDR